MKSESETAVIGTRPAVARLARYGGHALAVSASMPYTSVPPLTGSPSSSTWFSHGPGAGCAAPDPPVVVSDPPDPVVSDSAAVVDGSADSAAVSGVVPDSTASVAATAAVLALLLSSSSPQAATATSVRTDIVTSTV